MTDVIDELRPVDYQVVKLPGSDFNVEILPELAEPPTGNRPGP